jgi:phage terminase small subunit
MDFFMPRKAQTALTKPRIETRGRKKLTVDSPLTPRQEAFVREFVLKDGMITKREAAENAGYAPESAAQRAYELTDPRKHPNVVARIRALKSELDAKFGVTYERHLRDLQVIRDRALENGAYSAAVQAEYRRGQAHGDIYISKSEVRHGSIDSMSKEDVLKALQEIKRAQGNIIDVTPEAEEASEAHDAEDRRLAAPAGGHAGEPSESWIAGEAALEESEGWDEEGEAWDQSDEA